MIWKNGVVPKNESICKEYLRQVLNYNNHGKIPVYA